MPTDEQNTAPLTEGQKKRIDNLMKRAATGEFSKDPANPPQPEHRIKNAPFPDEDKQDW